MMKKILCVLFAAFMLFVLSICAAFAYVYYKTSFFDVERTITYYSNDKCTVTQVESRSFGDYWMDFYYGRLRYDEIDQDRCLVHCEIRGGFNGSFNGYISFNNDSIFIYPSSGAFYKINCNEDKLFLKKIDIDYDIKNSPNVIFIWASKSEMEEKHDIEVVTLPSQKVKRIFSVTDKSNVCDFYSSRKGERLKGTWGF